jgi:RimJ/RimL family protein N-acetyltransferase
LPVERPLHGAAIQLRTERLLLRQWRDTDREPFAAVNADSEVMRHFPSTMTRTQSDAFVDRASGLISQRGWGLWAVEVIGRAPFVGFVGLSVPSFDAHFTPAVEVGWRLSRAHWGHGYATEAAGAVVSYGFEDLGASRIVADVDADNEASLRVLEKLRFVVVGTGAERGATLLYYALDAASARQSRT